MHTHGDTYSVRGVPRRTSSRQELPPSRGAQVDAQVAALSERTAQLESTVRRLEATLAELDEQVREARQVSGSYGSRPASEVLEFRTTPSTQTRWIPGATPRSGSALRALRSEAATSNGSVSQF